MKKLFVLILVAGLLLTMVPAAMAQIVFTDDWVYLPDDPVTGTRYRTMSYIMAQKLGYIDQNNQPYTWNGAYTREDIVYLIALDKGAATPELGDSGVSTTVLALGALCLVTGAVVARKKRAA